MHRLNILVSFCINFMRKINTKNIINSSQFSTEPNSQASRKMTGKECSHSKINSFEVFQDQLTIRQNLILPSQRRTKSNFPSIMKKQRERGKSMRRELMNATNQINKLHKELSDKKIQIIQQKHQKKLSKFIDLLKISIEDRNENKIIYSQRPQIQSFFYPVPMPYSSFNYPNLPIQISRSQTRKMQYSRLKSKQKEKSGLRLKKNKRKLSKVTNIILFTIYLKNYCKRIRQSRKIHFKQLFPQLQSNLNSITSEIRKLLKQFFNLLFIKREINYDIEKNENKLVQKEKIEVIRKMVLMIIQVVRQWMQSSRLNKRIIKTLYYLCRHGNYSCTVPILTPDQLQMTCISAKFGYVSANYNLQNAAFINLIFIKIMIYNILLSPYKIYTQFQEETLSQNLYVIASVLYELAIDIQDQYMLLVPKSYKIGYSQQVKGIVTTKPLLYKNSFKIEGELISGLKGQSWTKKYFNFQSWNTQKQFIKQAVDNFHFAMVNYHKHVSKKYY